MSWIKENAYARVSVDLSNAQIVKYNKNDEVEESSGLLYKDYYKGGEENMHKDEIESELYCSANFKFVSSENLNHYMKKRNGVRIVAPEEYSTELESMSDSKQKTMRENYLFIDSPVKYSIILSIDTIDAGGTYLPLNPMMFKRANECVISGTMRVINNENDEIVLEATINKAHGYSGLLFTQRMAALINSELLINNICSAAYSKKQNH